MELRKIECTWKQVINYKQILENIVNNELPIKLSSIIARNALIIAQQINSLIKLEGELIQEHCIKDKDGNLIQENNKYIFKDEKEYLKELEKLLDAKVVLNISILPFIKLSELDGSLTPKQIIDLSFMISYD